MACAGFTATIWRVTSRSDSMRMQQDGCLTQSEPGTRPASARYRPPYASVHVPDARDVKAHTLGVCACVFPPEADGGRIRKLPSRGEDTKRNLKHAKESGRA